MWSISLLGWNANCRPIPSRLSGVTSPNPTLQQQIRNLMHLPWVIHLFLVSASGTSPHRTQDYVRTWTLAAFTDRSSLPTAVRLKHNEDDVYFAELIQSQLKPDGKGFGTFAQNGTISDVDEPAAPSTENALQGSLLKYVDCAQCGTKDSRSEL